MRMRSAVPSLLLAVLVQLPLAAGCSDDSAGPNGDDETLVGTWTATSLIAPIIGDLVAAGLDLELTLSAGGTATAVIAGDDLHAFCVDPATACTITGDYTSTSSTITLDLGDDDESTFTYQIQGSTMTWTGDIGGTPITASFQKN
ncbi:MAG TPA: hypothetical protein VMM12_06760 [Longimicrobiales bacterium]|nr:hypothetical protein [Longimicrobiales bacterium]